MGYVTLAVIPVVTFLVPYHVVSSTDLKIGQPWTKPMGVRSSNKLQWLNLTCLTRKHLKMQGCILNTVATDALVPDSTKPLHESMLTNHQQSLMAFIWGQFHTKCSRYLKSTFGKKNTCHKCFFMYSIIKNYLWVIFHSCPYCIL